MFTEEEWTDVIPANERAQSVVKAEHARKKHQVISKQCLERTLQTLGSPPKWEKIKTYAGTDEETEKVAPHLWRKKKQRFKKQKRPFCTGIKDDVGKESDSLQKLDAPKKRQEKPKVDTACAEQSRTHTS